jgi:hypothetical protein
VYPRAVRYVEHAVGPSAASGVVRPKYKYVTADGVGVGVLVGVGEGAAPEVDGVGVGDAGSPEVCDGVGVSVGVFVGVIDGVCDGSTQDDPSVILSPPPNIDPEHPQSM